MAEKLSFPKNRIKILLLEGVNESATDTFNAAGYTNIERLPKALDESELIQAVKDVHILGIRSATHVTPRVIDHAKHLLAIGCFCIGTNQVALNNAKSSGIPVFNAPFSNTRSVAELTIANIISLMRGLSEKNIAAHKGIWLKSPKGSNEVRGKTLGIVGYGRIGTQVGVLAEAMGMQVIYYDIASRLAIGNAKPTESLKELLANSDVVTLHVPETTTTKNMISARELDQMKPGSKLINSSRGTVVVIADVVAALKKGSLAGGAFDVFPVEPASNDKPFVSELQEFDSVILTPHIGSGTMEAQFNIGVEVAEKLSFYSDNGSTTMAVNFPEVDLPPQQGKHRLLHIHQNKPGVLSKINEVLSSQNVNIAAQYLQTDPEIGYVVIDIDPPPNTLDIKLLWQVEGTVKVRVLY